MMRSTFFFESVPQQSSAPSFKVVVLGSASVGKTSLINRFCFETFSQTYQPSMGFPHQSSTTRVGDQQVTLRLWEVNVDRANQYGNAQRLAYEGAAAYVVLFDVTNIASFQAATEHLNKLKNENVSIILAGTKSDLLAHRVVSDEKAQALASEAGCEYFATSSRNDTNVDALFQHAAKVLLAKPACDQENDWVLVNEDVCHGRKLSTILTDEVWVKSEGMLSKLKSGLKEMISTLNDHTKKSEHDYLADIQKIAQAYSKEKEKTLLPFFSSANKDTPLKAAYHAISSASSLSDATISVQKIKNQLSPAIDPQRADRARDTKTF